MLAKVLPIFLMITIIPSCKKRVDNVSKLDDGYDNHRIECTATQLSTIENSIDEAKVLLTKSANSFPINNSENGKNFKTWFGGEDGDIGESVGKIYEEILAFVDAKFIWCPNASFETDDVGTLAFVPADSITEVFIQSGFFNLPNAEDTKAGVIIHEYSHLVASTNIVDSDVTGDGDADYGKQNARQLARTNQSQARRTADNFLYYSQSKK